LGEPGTGKSHSIQTIRESERLSSQEKGNRLLWFDLREYGNEERLIREVFANETVEAWKQGKGLLHLFLDSLDECLIRITTVAAILSSRLPELPIDRLRLRIACRTADWPITLETALRGAYGNEAVKIYELAPLRKIDVEEALKTNGIEPTTFFDEIETLHAVPLAIKPITLDFLMRTYLRNRCFPSSQADLYLEGCRLLCDETSSSRRVSGLAGSLSPTQRLAIAMRIAAVTMFSNKYAVWTGIDRGDVPEDDVTLQQLSGGREGSSGEDVLATEAAIKETLGTGLFSSRGSVRMGWAHQTYAEFLAARFVFEHELSVKQINTLIIHSGDAEGKVVPQLGQTAAWISDLNSEVFSHIVQRDPEILLRSNASNALSEGRKNLVGGLLNSADNEKLVPFNLVNLSNLASLAYPNMAGQLRPYIQDTHKNEFARHLAIDIAHACQVTELAEDLTVVVFDEKQALPIRVNAAYAVAKIGDDTSKAKLKPLATMELNDDPQDELKGCALRAAWPQHLSSEELFSSLTPRKDSSLFGSYVRFTANQLPREIRSSDLPAALNWLEKLSETENSPDEFSELTNAIILRAWDNLLDSEIAIALANCILMRLHKYHQVFSHSSSASSSELTKFVNELKQDDDKRRVLLEEILFALPHQMMAGYFLVHCNPPLVTHGDLYWLLDFSKVTSDKALKRQIAEIIQRIVDWKNIAELDAVLVACKTEPIFAETFAWLIKPIELDSPAAEHLKKTFREEKELLEQRQNRPLVQPPPEERIENSLAQIENGNVDAWWLLCMDLTLEPTSTHYQGEFESNLTGLPGWKKTDPATRSRILDAAELFIVTHVPKKEEWLGKNIFHHKDFSEYKAFQLLLEESPTVVTSFDRACWVKWASVILAYPVVTAADDDAVFKQLIMQAYSKAPGETLSTLDSLMDHEISTNKHVFVIQKVLGCWDDRIAEALLEKAKTANLNSTSLDGLLDVLLSKQHQSTREFVESLITPTALNSPESRDRAVTAARPLVMNADDAGWQLIWPLIEEDESFGKELMESLSFIPGEKRNFVDRLDEKQIGELYVWLCRHYPYGESRGSGFGFVGPSFHVGMLRESLLGELKTRGTVRAIDVLAEAVRQLPEVKWLKFQLIEARNHTRARTWTPPEPKDLLILARESQSRLVQSGQQLLDVIIESLERLQKKLHGETPEVQFLWNKIADKVYRPCDETALSDYIKIHLNTAS
jgi:predicted NACHT family NTPase